MGQRNCPCPAGYNVIHTDPPQNGGHSGGCGLMWRRDVPFNRLHLRTNLQAVAGRVHLDRIYTVCSVYLPPHPSEGVSRQSLEELIRELPEPFILTGDMNARHYNWGDYDCNSRGNIINRMVEDYNLTILNSGEPTHFDKAHGALTVVDLTICSPTVALSFVWEVGHTLRGSDHYPTGLQAVEAQPAQCLPKWCIQRADWQTFQGALQLDSEVQDFENVDEAVDHFVSRILLAASISIPRTSGTFPRRPVPWWNQDCTAAKRISRRAESRFRSCPTSQDLKIEFNRARARYRRIMKDARQGSWRTYVSSINSSTPLPKIWQRIRKMKGKFVPSSAPMLTVDGEDVAEPAVVANHFATHFANVPRNDPTCPHARRRLHDEGREVNFSSPGGESYNVPFQLQELAEALKACDETAPGPDDVPYAMLRHLSDLGQRFLLGLYNKVWIEGVFPSVWGVATVIPIPKPGKDHSRVNNFRPISLTSCLCKLLEKMVNFRLMWVLEKEKFISPLQCGFRKHYSTSNALVTLESSVCRAFAANQHHVTVFFDLEKAYDTAWRHGILKVLHELGLRGNMPVLIRNFLQNRFIRVRVGTATSPDHQLPGGIPQGSVLSVTLFAVAINGILDVLPEGVRGQLYVDDLSISFAASKMPVAERRLQLAIERICEWADCRGFRFSKSKTVVVHFCKIRGVHADPDLYLYGSRIPCKEEARFLGLIFDRRLSWLPHLKSVKADCLKALNLLKALSHISWGADRKTLLRLHESLVLSKLEYGSEVYSSATPARLRMLDAVHHEGIRLATGAFKSSPIPSLLVDAGALPLDIKRQNHILQCWFRMKRLPRSIANQAVMADSESRIFNSRPSFPKPLGYRAKVIADALAVPAVPILEHKVPKIGPWLTPEVTVCKILPEGRSTLNPEVQRAFFLDHMCSHDGTLPVFTDGSKTNTGAGFGVVFPSFSRSISIPWVSSIFTAELRAILFSLKEIYTLQETAFTIFSDSFSSLQAIASIRSQHPLVLEIIEWLLLNKRRGKTVNFCWVPAHTGVAGNEEADTLAKAAAATHPVRRLAVPVEDIKPSIRRRVHEAWQDRWSNIGPNKLRAIKPSIKPWPYQGLSRRWETALARLRIGHSKMTHGHLMEGDPPPYCADCIVPLTIEHLLAECPSFGEIRNRHLGALRRENGTYALSSILGEESCSMEGGTLRFLEEADLLRFL